MDQRLYSPQAPLPGTRIPSRGLFVDRWGTLLEPADGPVLRFADARFYDGAVDALFRAHRAGWTLYLLGNEDDVPAGRLEADAWARFEQELLEALAGGGALIKRSYADLEGPQDSGTGHLESVFRLPNTGALYHASHTDGIHLDRSWVLGDSTLELVAGWRAGCHVAGVRTGEAMRDGAFHVEPEILAPSLAEAVAEIVATQPVPAL